MIRPSDSEASRRANWNMREAIPCAAEELFLDEWIQRGLGCDIAQAAGANPGSVTYHFKDQGRLAA